MTSSLPAVGAAGAGRKGVSSGLLRVLMLIYNTGCTEPPVARAPSPRSEPTAERNSVERFTFSPQPVRAPDRVSTHCGVPDAGLRSAAQALLEEYEKTSRLPSSEALGFALRSAGVPYVWVRSWAATAPDLPAIDGALATWTQALPEPLNRRCGVELSTHGASLRAVALVADVLADVSPIPRTGRVGQWLGLKAQIHVEATQLALLALGPHGAPHQLPAQLSETGLVRAQLPLATPGRWLFQLLPTTANGPRPVAEIEVFADVPLPRSPEQQIIPGDVPECATECHPEQLFVMLNRARASEKLPPLRRDSRLDELAAEHAEAMQANARLAHDVGAGDAYIRVSPDFPDSPLLGENIAHATNLRAAHRALWLSPAHRQNLLRREYGIVGVGVAQGTDGEVWVCQLFAAQTAPSATY